MNILKSKGKIAEEQHNDTIVNDNSITKNHQKLALEVLLPEVKDTVLKLEESEMLNLKQFLGLELYNMLMINLTSSTALLLSIMLQIFWQHT